MSINLKDLVEPDVFRELLEPELQFSKELIARHSGPTEPLQFNRILTDTRRLVPAKHTGQ